MVAKQQEKVLKSFSKEEALHFVPKSWITGILDVSDRAVTAFRDLRVFLESLEDLPTIILVFFISS